MHHHHLATAALLAFTLQAAAAPAAPAPVTVRQTPDAILLDNGIVTLAIDKKTTDIRSLLYHPVAGQSTELGAGNAHVVYWDCNATPVKVPTDRKKRLPKAGYFRPFQALNRLAVASATPEMADVIIDAGPSEWFNFHAQFHYVLRRGDSGFYLYAQLQHGQGMPAAAIAQVRSVIRAENQGRLFTNEIIDENRKGPAPSSKRLSNPQDATYRLADGSAYTKYDMTQFVSRFSAYGFAGHDLGIWFTWPSNEFSNGGPFKQELTVQIDNIMQVLYQGQHFGAPAIKLADGEPWSKLFGPVFVYVNHGGTPDALWNDARKQAAIQKSHWPYTWLHNPDYPLDRGDADGRIVLQNAPQDKIANAWVILDTDEPGEQNADFEMRSRGYHFWTRADADGRFHIPNLRPGHYTLFVCGADQFEPFKKTGIIVDAHRTTHLGTLDWPAITHGRRLWQIGAADRSTAEFHDGAQPDYRNYDAFRHYFSTFPHDVTFTIGQSKEATDWEYAQWSWYNEKPEWTIRFTLAPADIPARGAATLTLGIASAQPAGALLVGVNGKNVASLALPKTGGAGYRSGAQDSTYLVKYIPFDATLLHPGENTITLGQSRMTKFTPELLATKLRPKNDIMYDAVRLEVHPLP